MKTIENPFLIASYHSPAYFCDRKPDTKKIIDTLVNGRNLTLLSIRRIGKTGLIKHVFYNLQKKKNWQVIYIDIMPTENLCEFIKAFTTAVVEQEWRKSKNYLKKVAFLLSGIKAKLSFDDISGVPEITFDYKTPSEATKSLSEIFSYLSKQDTNYAIAIDEFQQIAKYPEKNTEALLRSYIQHLSNVHFIFSGSNRHLLTTMFADKNRPFFQSTDFMHLERIDTEIYTDYIYKKFTEAKKSITPDLIKEAILYYQTHTFYVQYFFNKLFELSQKKVTEDLVAHVHNLIVKEREYTFYDYRNLLTSYQFQLLKAIAKEGGISQPNAGNFIATYALRQNSSVNRALKALIDKDMVYEENGAYYVYDVFFAKWLAKLP